MKTKKKDKMKSIDQKRMFDKKYCTAVIAAFIVVTIWEVFDLPLPLWIITKLSLTDSLLAVLQIQVTIALLPLTIIALITGISKDSLYGVPILKYVMHLRPVLLKYRNIVFIQIILIIVSFIFTSLEMYNHLVLWLFITIGNSTIMMLDCFSLLSDFEYYKAEIRDYLIDKLRIEDFSILVNYIVKTKNEVSIEDLKDNLSVLNELLFVASNKTENFNYFELQCSTCIKKLFSSQKSDIFLCTVDALQMAYHNFNEKEKELQIFSDVDYEFYNGLKYLNLTNARDLRVLDNLRYELFRNSAYSETNELYPFTALVYQFAVLNNVYSLNDALSKNTIINKLNDWFSPYKELTNLERCNRLYFFKALVDNKSKSNLDKKVFSIADIRPDNDLADKLIIILYIYYIATDEPMADPKIKKFCQRYISCSSTRLKFIMDACKYDYISSNDVKLSYKLMKAWEVIKINHVKTLRFDSVTNDFWTFFSLAVTPLGCSLSNRLKEITKGNEFSLYDQYFANEDTAKQTEKKYQHFCDLFGFEFKVTAIRSLQSFLSEEFKKKSIQEAKDEHEAMRNNTEFLHKQSQIVGWYCDQLSNYFSYEPKKVISKHITLINSIEFSLDISKHKNKPLQNMIRAQFLEAICDIIESYIITEEVKYGESIIPTIKELSEKYSCNTVDTVIGSKNCFSYSERDQGNQIMGNFGEYFLSRNISDTLFFISKAKCFMNLSNIKINLQEISREEILNENLPDENGVYPYVITNNLNGYFTEDELVEFLQNRLVKLEITCDLTYDFSSKHIGYGIIRSQ